MVASLTFAPEIVLTAIEYFVNALKLDDQHSYGFKATFNQTWSNAG